MSTVRRRSEGTVEEFASLPYHLTLVRDDEEKGKPWTATVEELPGCTTRGRTPDEALSGVQAALTSWIEVALEQGREIPQPKSAGSHSGRLLLRMPRTLHAELTRVADREGVSLNQFITDSLASAVGWRGPNEGKAVGSAPVSQEPGAASLTADPQAPARSRRNSGAMVTAALAANFLIVAIAGIVAIIVLIAAWN